MPTATRMKITPTTIGTMITHAAISSSDTATNAVPCKYTCIEQPKTLIITSYTHT